MRSCAGDRGRLLAVSYPLSALRRLVGGESRQRLATFSLKSRCSLSEAMHKMKCLISPWGTQSACGAGEDSPLNPLSLMNS